MSRKFMRKALVATALLAALPLVLAGCQSGTGAATAGEVTATDDGAKLTMWTRSSTAQISQAFVDSYNESHKNQVELTVLPFDSYQQKVGTAAGSKQLPDILSSDVVYTPNYISKGLFRDLTAEIDALDFADALAPGQIAAGTQDGKKYAVPHTIDLSEVFYNKVLFKKAGLDPENPPTTLEGWFDAARKIQALDDGSSGFYFGGNCGGCMLFTTWPSIWADGGTIMNDDGTEATLDTPEANAVYELYRQAQADGLAPAGSKTETGATFTTPFSTGTIGWQILGSASYGTIPQSDSLEIGIAPVPGVEGGTSSFIGGDTVSISATSSKAAQAWDFLSWTLSEDAQVDVLAQLGNLTVRTDLASNQYSEADPNVVALGKALLFGETPLAVNFGSSFNDANGPWTSYFRNQIYGDGNSFEKDNAAITSSLESGS